MKVVVWWRVLRGDTTLVVLSVCIEANHGSPKTQQRQERRHRSRAVGPNSFARRLFREEGRENVSDPEAPSDSDNDFGRCGKRHDAPHTEGGILRPESNDAC